MERSQSAAFALLQCTNPGFLAHEIHICWETVSGSEIPSGTVKKNVRRSFVNVGGWISEAVQICVICVVFCGLAPPVLRYD